MIHAGVGGGARRHVRRGDRRVVERRIVTLPQALVPAPGINAAVPEPLGVSVITSPPPPPAINSPGWSPLAIGKFCWRASMAGGHQAFAASGPTGAGVNCPFTWPS